MRLSWHKTHLPTIDRISIKTNQPERVLENLFQGSRPGPFSFECLSAPKIILKYNCPWKNIKEWSLQEAGGLLFLTVPSGWVYFPGMNFFSFTSLSPICKEASSGTDPLILGSTASKLSSWWITQSWALLRKHRRNRTLSFSNYSVIDLV